MAVGGRPSPYFVVQFLDLKKYQIESCMRPFQAKEKTGTEAFPNWSLHYVGNVTWTFLEVLTIEENAYFSGAKVTPIERCI